MRQGRVFCNDVAAGIITEDEHGYKKTYSNREKTDQGTT